MRRSVLDYDKGSVCDSRGCTQLDAITAESPVRKNAGERRKLPTDVWNDEKANISARRSGKHFRSG